MSIAPAIPSTLYALLGANLGPFATVWPYEVPTDVQVYVDDGQPGGPILLSSGVDYTLVGVGSIAGGGSVTLMADLLTGGAWPAGSRLVLQRGTALDQPSAFGEVQGFSPAACEAAIDHLDRQIQDLKAQLKSTVSYRVSEVPAALPTRQARAGKLAVWDIVGDASLTWADAAQIAKGDPGGNAMALGLWSAFTGLTIPVGTDIVQTSGFSRVGVGAARYAVDADQVTVTASAIRQQSLNGRWFLLAEPITTWPMIGAIGDGIVDNAAAFNAASAFGRGLYGAPGTYLVGDNVTFTVKVDLSAGAAIVSPANTKAVAFNGGFVGPMGQCFANATAGQGAITFDPRFFDTGYPEWWGCLTNTGGGPVLAANLAAMTACDVACPVSQYRPADYFFYPTFKRVTSYRTLKGHHKHFGVTGNSTRLLIVDAALDAIQNGPDVMPALIGFPGIGNINAFTTELWIRDMSVSRTPAITGNAIYNTCPAGIRTQWCLEGGIDNVWSDEHCLGFIFKGAVSFKATNNYAFRSVTGTNPAADPFIGYFYDGSVNWGAAGGNASLYLVGNNTTAGGAYATATLAGTAAFFSCDVYGLAGCTDWFIDRSEMASLQYGLYIDGAGQIVGGTQDFNCSDCVWDSAKIAPISINNVNGQTALNLKGNYGALGISPLFRAGLEVVGCSGVIAVLGGQLLGGLNATDIGISVVNTKGFKISGTILRECHIPIKLNGATNFNIEAFINNPTIAGANGAVWCTGVNDRGRIAVDVQGGAGVFDKGVKMDGVTTTHTEVNCTCIDPFAINGGAANKLWCNGASVAAVNTAFNGSNLTSGIMA